MITVEELPWFPASIDEIGKPRNEISAADSLLMQRFNR
jgi:hypothetical protein